MVNPAPETATILSNERLRQSLAVRDWLLGEAREIGDPNIILEVVSLMLRDAGVPIDRTTSAVELRHAERAANARIWEFGSSAEEYLYAHERGSDASGKRPLAEAHRLNDWIFTWLPDTPDDAYDIVAPLKAAGYTHHIAVPVVLPNGMHNGFTFATRAPNGFSDQDVAILRSIFPTLAALQEVLALQRIMREVMRMYVGDEPHLRILSGDVRRGEVLRIRAAILFADMRDFTGLTAHLSEEGATALVNEYYDCIVPPIDERGGEVLKFMGDGILAIFRAGEKGDIEACLRAFAAARAGLLKVARRNDTTNSAARFGVGIALHFGNAAYGNVGSGARLDYTVIGRDVNLASRIADLCGRLGQSLLLSSPFQSRLSEHELKTVGSFPLKGVSQPQTVFAPVEPEQDPLTAAGTGNWRLREQERIVTGNDALFGRKHLLVGLTRVRNEALLLPDTLNYLARHVDAIVAYDDASTDETVQILRAHPKVALIVANQAWEEDMAARKLAEGRHRGLLLDMARAELPHDWMLCFDPDERVTGDLRAFVQGLGADPCDAVRVKLFDAYMTHEDHAPYSSERKLLDFRRFFGPEQRDILMLWRNRPEIVFAAGDGRTPRGMGSVKTDLYCQHYGKSLSVAHWEETCDYYIKHFPYDTYGKKWTERKGKGIHTESDFNRPLYEWGETLFANAVLMGAA